MPRNLTTFVLPAVLAAGLATQTSAQGDAGLYEPAPDPDASFVRLIAPDTEFGTIAAKAMNGIDDITAYVSVTPGAVQVKAGDANTTVEVEKGKYYSVVMGADATPTTLTDTIIASPAKADLAFYNLTDMPGLSLYVPAATANVAEGIDPGATAAVSLRAPLTLDFEVRDGDTVIATIPAVELRRKEGVSVVITGSGGTYTGFASSNTFLY